MRLKKLTAALMAFILLFACRPPVGAAEEDDDPENENQVIWSRETTVSPDILSVETLFSNGSRQAEHSGLPKISRSRSAVTL